ncbi:MAG: GNAT family N-acetyltransferase [Hyphomicrobiaceae bacterium]|nr:GNAT family N-acetyltransferase [Hyphomicrobiaceae bacterium]
MTSLSVKPLVEESWPAFAALVEANNGVWGGCWCLGFHSVQPGWGSNTDVSRQAKLERVQNGSTHSALVFDGDACVGWCQYGSPTELPRIKNKKAYDADLVSLPDWRITCFFVGKGHRGKGVAAAGLRGALDMIAKAGGGVVEGYPEDTAGRKVSGSFLFNGALSSFEREGFEKERMIGKHKWVVRKVVAGV